MVRTGFFHHLFCFKGSRRELADQQLCLKKCLCAHTGALDRSNVRRVKWDIYLNSGFQELVKQSGLGLLVSQQQNLS